VALAHFAARKKTFRNVLALKNRARQNGRRRVDNFLVSHDVRGSLRNVDLLAQSVALWFVGRKRRLSWKTAACFFQIPLQSFRNQEAAKMQMITRRVNEAVVIENDIHVTVLDICQDYVRVAISSPNNTLPYREETLYWEESPEESAGELLLQ
jgi:carbon storage regulator CsrA